MLFAGDGDFPQVDDVWWVLREPAPLGGMRYPHNVDWQRLAEAGVSLVMQLEPGAYSCEPLQRLVIDLEDQISRERPTNPAEEWLRIRRVVDAIVPALNAGQGVIVHCLGGIGRTGTVIACTLRELGASTTETFTQLEQRGRRLESPWQSAVVHAWPNQPVL